MKILLACVLCGYKSLWFLSGWCRSDGQESHCGHVRWLGGPRGRSFLWKGLHQGGPLGRLRCTLGGKISGEGPAVQAGTGAGETSFQFNLLQKVSEMCAGWKESFYVNHSFGFLWDSFFYIFKVEAVMLVITLRFKTSACEGKQSKGLNREGWWCTKVQLKVN